MPDTKSRREASLDRNDDEGGGGGGGGGGAIVYIIYSAAWGGGIETLISIGIVLSGHGRHCWGDYLVFWPPHALK